MSELISKPTQVEKVLDYMRKHGSINFMDAWNKLGISQIGARIWEIQHEKNIPIYTKQRCFVAADGTKGKYVDYFIGKEEEK